MVLQLIVDKLAKPVLELEQSKVPIEAAGKRFSEDIELLVKLLKEKSKDAIDTNLSFFKGIKNFNNELNGDDILLLYLGAERCSKINELIELIDINTGGKFLRELLNKKNLMLLFDETLDGTHGQHIEDICYYNEDIDDINVVGKKLKFLFKKEPTDSDVVINLSDSDVVGKNITKPELVILSYF